MHFGVVFENAYIPLCFTRYPHQYPVGRDKEEEKTRNNQETMTLQQRKIHEGQHMGTHKVSKEMLARSPLPLRPK